MPKLDPRRLIQQTHELLKDSRQLRERCQHTINESKRLQGIRETLSTPQDSASRKRLPAK